MSPRRRTIIGMLAASALIVAPALTGHGPRLMWNASASVPVGLYAVTQIDRIEVGDLVAVTPPGGLAAFLDTRGYLPRGVPLIKRVLAVPGTEVCRNGATIAVNDRVWGEARARDSNGRDLPRWQGCRMIAKSEVFLMNRSVPDSLDSRYFGPLPVTSAVARLVPIWTDEDGDGRFEWRASTR